MAARLSSAHKVFPYGILALTDVPTSIRHSTVFCRLSATSDIPQVPRQSLTLDTLSPGNSWHWTLCLLGILFPYRTYWMIVNRIGHREDNLLNFFLIKVVFLYSYFLEYYLTTIRIYLLASCMVFQLMHLCSNNYKRFALMVHWLAGQILSKSSYC